MFDDEAEAQFAKDAYGNLTVKAVTEDLLDKPVVK